METQAPPIIFAPTRRSAALHRAVQLQRLPGAATYLFDDVAEDLVERLSFLRHEPRKCLVAGDPTGRVARSIAAAGREILSAGFDLESPWPTAGFDLIVCSFALDAANDLPGALIHLRRALAPGGFAVVAMVGAGSLPVLREVMLAADCDRPAPRLHPQVDVRAGAQLLQRVGLSNPVADSRTLRVRFGSLRRLVGDLRAQGLSNCLADPGPILRKDGLRRAESAFAALGNSEGRVTETFEILTLSGWRSA